MHLNDNVLYIKAIYPFENKTYKSEEMEIIINNIILKNDELRLALIARLNRYNCVRQETTVNIGNLLFKPENIRKRLMAIS